MVLHLLALACTTYLMAANVKNASLNCEQGGSVGNETTALCFATFSTRSTTSVKVSLIVTLPTAWGWSWRKRDWNINRNHHPRIWSSCGWWSIMIVKYQHCAVKGKSISNHFPQPYGSIWNWYQKLECHGRIWGILSNRCKLCKSLSTMTTTKLTKRPIFSRPKLLQCEYHWSNLLKDYVFHPSIVGS